MSSEVKARLKCYALRIISIKRIQDSIRNKLNNSNFALCIIVLLKYVIITPISSQNFIRYILSP